MLAPPLPGADQPDESRGPNILGAVISTTSTAFIVVILRTYSRICMVQSFGADDYVIILAMLLSLTGMGLIIADVQYGAGRHVVYLDPEVVRIGLKLNFALQPIFQWAIPIAKISIGLSLIRTRPALIYKRTIQGLFIFLLAFTSARFALLMLQCINLAAIWDPRVDSKCLSLGTMRGIRYTNSIVNIITDILVTLLAALILWKIQSNTRAKFSLICVLSIGIIACVAALMKPVSLMKRGEIGDTLWDSIDLTIWNPVELNMGIIAASVACLSPMFQKLDRRVPHPSLFSISDSYCLHPFSSYSSGRRASNYFHSHTRTEISSQYSRGTSGSAGNRDEERGPEHMPNEITRTTVISVNSVAKERVGSSGSQQSHPARVVEDKL